MEMFFSCSSFAHRLVISVNPFQSILPPQKSKVVSNVYCNFLFRCCSYIFFSILSYIYTDIYIHEGIALYLIASFVNGILSLSFPTHMHSYLQLWTLLLPFHLSFKRVNTVGVCTFPCLPEHVQRTVYIEFLSSERVFCHVRILFKLHF